MEDSGGRLRGKIRDRESGLRSLKEKKEREDRSNSLRTPNQIFYDIIEDYGDAITTGSMARIEEIFSRDLAKFVRKKVLAMKAKGLVLAIQHEGIDGGNPEEEIILDDKDEMVVRYDFLDTSYFIDSNKEIVGQNPGEENHLLISISKQGNKYKIERIGEAE